MSSFTPHGSFIGLCIATLLGVSSAPGQTVPPVPEAQAAAQQPAQVGVDVKRQRNQAKTSSGAKSSDTTNYVLLYQLTIINRSKRSLNDLHAELTGNVVTTIKSRGKTFTKSKPANRTRSVQSIKEGEMVTVWIGPVEIEETRGNVVRTDTQGRMSGYDGYNVREALKDGTIRLYEGTQLIWEGRAK